MRADSHFVILLVKLTRIARGWRQADLARAITVSRERISQIETGRSNPGPDFLDRLATALDSATLHKIAAARRLR